MMDNDLKASAIRDLAQYVGMELKSARIRRKMTIAQLSTQTGITASALSKIERGETDVKLSTLAVIRTALALNISVTTL